MRIGFGIDTHALAAGRKLILGGVDIPHEKGLDGHSDADVLAHAISDALLGAAGLGDIGRHFPDTDDRFKGADSIALMREVYAMVEGGYMVENIDATIVAQKPRLAPYIDEMRGNIAQAIGIEKDRVNIKASTTETLGFEGRQEGISAYAACLLTEVE